MSPCRFHMVKTQSHMELKSRQVLVDISMWMKGPMGSTHSLKQNTKLEHSQKHRPRRLQKPPLGRWSSWLWSGIWGPCSKMYERLPTENEKEINESAIRETKAFHAPALRGLMYH